MRWQESLGIHCKLVKNTTTEKDYPLGKIEIKAFMSMAFEIVMFLTLSIFYFFTRRTESNIKYLDEHALEVKQMIEKEAEEK